MKKSSSDKSESNTASVSRRDILLGGSSLAVTALTVAATTHPTLAQAQTSGGNQSAASGKKPNILVIFGDDIGIPQISAYTMGLMGYRTPNIDRIAKRRRNLYGFLWAAKLYCGPGFLHSWSGAIPDGSAYHWYAGGSTWNPRLDADNSRCDESAGLCDGSVWQEPSWRSGPASAYKPWLR